MPSRLRHQSSLEEPTSANATYQTSPTLPPAKKQKMSLTQTYYVASTARSKLGKEASQADHNLRLLVGHANLLDQLMVDLADAEREQEAWFNQSVRKACRPQEPAHVQWVDTIREEEVEEDEDDSDSDSDLEGSIYDEDEFDMIPVRKLKSPPVEIESVELHDDEYDDMMDEDEDEDEDEDPYRLTRVPSHPVDFPLHSPPELLHDSDSEDDEQDSTPPSPDTDQALHMDLDDKAREAIATTSFYGKSTDRSLEDYILQQAQRPSQPMIATY